jgi:hypothetical protein
MINKFALASFGGNRMFVLVAVSMLSVFGFADGKLPVDPRSVLGKPLEEVEKIKGAKGEQQLAKNASGEFLSHVIYREAWFGLPDPIEVQYIVHDKPTHPMHQITLNYITPGIRGKVIDAMKATLGDCIEGKSDPSAPSIYFAQWVKGGIMYDLQDYEDRVEVYISPAHFIDAAKYGKSDDLWLIDATYPKFGDTSGRVLLVGDAEKFDSHHKTLFLVVERTEGKKGELIKLPESVSTGTKPVLSLEDLDGDKVLDALIISTTESTGGSYSGLAYSLGVEPAKALPIPPEKLRSK